jgi:hypothetical protein
MTYSRPFLISLLGLLWLLAASLPALAKGELEPLPQAVSDKYGAMQLRGGGQLKFLGMRVYNARLFIKPPLGADVAFDRDFALDIGYLMSLKGAAIADRSAKEMRRVGYQDEAKLARWTSRMKELFPDVQAGDHLVGVFDIEGGKDDKKAKASFYIVQRSKVKLLGAVDDSEFARAFFDIWLSPKTSEPKLRAALLKPVDSATGDAQAAGKSPPQ